LRHIIIAMPIQLWYYFKDQRNVTNSTSLYEFDCFIITNFRLTDKDRLYFYGNGFKSHLIIESGHPNHIISCDACFSVISHFEQVFNNRIIFKFINIDFGFIVKLDDINENDQLLNAFINSNNIHLIYDETRFINDNEIAEKCFKKGKILRQKINKYMKHYNGFKYIDRLNTTFEIFIFNYVYLLPFIQKYFQGFMVGQKTCLHRHTSHLILEIIYINSNVLKIIVNQINVFDKLKNSIKCVIYVTRHRRPIYWINDFAIEIQNIKNVLNDLNIKYTTSDYIEKCYNTIYAFSFNIEHLNYHFGNDFDIIDYDVNILSHDLITNILKAISYKISIVYATHFQNKSYTYLDKYIEHLC
jgi:hypothetical protein